MCSCGSKGPMGDPLDEARRLAEQGRFEEALQKHIWLHDHVLESQPSYYGVRLSFALADWVDLGRKYPKALEALKSIRDKKTSRLVAGEGDKRLFHDVRSINENLGESKETVELFKQIEARRPEFASSIYDLADKEMIEAGEYALARRYLGDPAARLSTARSHFDSGLVFARTGQRGDASRQAFETIFTERVVRIITVLDKTGEHELARRIQSEALKVLDNSGIRNATSN